MREMCAGLRWLLGTVLPSWHWNLLESMRSVSVADCFAPKTRNLFRHWLLCTTKPENCVVTDYCAANHQTTNQCRQWLLRREPPNHKPVSSVITAPRTTKPKTCVVTDYCAANHQTRNLCRRWSLRREPPNQKPVSSLMVTLWTTKETPNKKGSR